jgi:hypothetical protein
MASFSKLLKTPEPIALLTNTKTTISQLKAEIKKNRIRVKGLSTMKKQNIIDILNCFYKKRDSGHRINAFIHKHLFAFFRRRCEVLRGDSLSHRNECINDTDFYTMEPLKTISPHLFFCFQEKGFYYGFNIFSFHCIVPFYGSRKKCLNPYTRESVDISVQNTVSNLVRLMKIIEPPELSPMEEPLTVPETARISGISDTLRFMGNTLYPPIGGGLSEIQKNLMNELIERRKKPISTRIEELFYEIDLLGNYTQRRWFDDLDRSQCMGFFSQLHDFWNQHGNLRSTVKWEVCSLTGDPFYNIFIFSQPYITEEQIKEGCLLVMENLTYTGMDDESKKTGIIYILLHLANVSGDVRQSISWLQ